jgi:molecular chaperone DnaK (HSP70)
MDTQSEGSIVMTKTDVKLGATEIDNAKKRMEQMGQKSKGMRSTVEEFVEGQWLEWQKANLPKQDKDMFTNILSEAEHWLRTNPDASDDECRQKFKQLKQALDDIKYRESDDL